MERNDYIKSTTTRFFNTSNTQPWMKSPMLADNEDVVMEMQDASKKDANTKVVDELKQYLASGQTSVITSPEQD